MRRRLGIIQRIKRFRPLLGFGECYASHTAAAPQRNLSKSPDLGDVSAAVRLFA